MTDWRRVRLDQVAEITAGNPAPQDPADFTRAGLPFVRMQDVGRAHITRFFISTADQLTLDSVQRNRLRLFPKGTLLIPKSGASVNLNHRALLGVDAYVVSHLAAVIPDRTKIEPDFLYYWSLIYDPRHQAQTTSLPSLPTSLIKAATINIPPLAEQRRIVDVLSRAEGIASLRREAQDKARAVTPALYLDLFGKILERDYVRCAELCGFITKGTTPKASDITSTLGESSVPYIKVLHITDEGRLNLKKSPAFIDRRLHISTLARSIVYPGDVLMNIVGPPLGRICLVPDGFSEWNVNQALAIFRPSRNLLSEFLFYTLRSPLILPKILRLSVGVRQLNISLEQCRNLRIPVPSLEQQTYFVDKAKAMRSIIDAQDLALERAEMAFQSLLARTFRRDLADGMAAFIEPSEALLAAI